MSQPPKRELKEYVAIGHTEAENHFRTQQSQAQQPSNSSETVSYTHLDVYKRQLLSGGSGHCYGSSLADFRDDWRQKIQLRGAQDMELYFKIFSGLPWYLFRPDTTCLLYTSRCV